MEQCKEIEDKTRMGKARNLFKKFGDIKAKFHVRMGTIKDRNVMNLTESEGIKKRGRIHRRTVQKNLHDPDNHHVVITHLEPDILGCKVNWALGSITTKKARR